MKFWRWLADRLKDLFYTVGNEHLDLARVCTGIFTGLVTFAVYWNAIRLQKEIDLNGLLTGLAAFATASGLGILAKEWARKKVAEATAAAKCADESDQ